jgi:hypothetical protein
MVLAAAVAVASLTVAALTPAESAAKPATYRSPGYRGTHKLPKVAPVPPPAPAVLGPGSLPHLLVDNAGTAHIAWTQGLNTESVIRYCRLPRGQRTCAASSSMIPPDNDSGYGNSPVTDIDFHGPTPLSVGNQLLLLDTRCCNGVPLPDGTVSSNPNFLYTSDNGGGTFTGPGIIGTQVASGNALIYGGANPSIGVISDTQTGGTFFQGTPAGAFTRAVANLGATGPDQAYNGRLALDGTRPVAAFSDLSGHIFIREYGGTGDVNDAANWSMSQIPGDEPRLAGGPSGVWLAYHPTQIATNWLVRRVVGGVAIGAPVQIIPSGVDTGYFTMVESPGGELVATWINRNIAPQQIFVKTSGDGVHWSTAEVVANSNVASYIAVAAAPDGGGNVVWQQRTTSSAETVIATAPFGPINANGQTGLGNLNGQGLGGLGGDEFGTVSCTDVHFGAVDALAEAGCFLRDPSHPDSGAAVTSGQIRLNGLEVIPDPGAQIIIDPRRHTIDTTGAVSVNLRAPGIADITLWHGELHVNLSGGLAGVGQTLFDFDTRQFSAGLEGFPIQGNINVQLQQDAVVIPISLKLPPYMGGVSGAATLLADNAHGLQLTSLHIGVDDLLLGALEVKDLNIDYTRSGDVWKGGARLNVPAGSGFFGIDVQVEFDHGDFTMGSFNVFLPFPGVPLFTDAYLDGFGGGFDIHPPRKRFFGSIEVGAIPLDPPNYAVTVSGTVSITFVENGPVILEVDGAGAVHGFRLANGKLVFQTNGYLEVDGNVDIDLSVVELRAGLSAFVDLPAKEFSSQVQGELLLAGYDVAGADAVISSIGAAACGEEFGLNLGFGYTWGGSVNVIGPGLGSCDLSAYVVQPVSNAAKDGRAHAAAASVPVASGTSFEDIAVTGAGAPPSVVLTSPRGQQITPAALAAGTAGAPAVAVTVPVADTTYVMVPHPAAGGWTVSAAPGSPPITSVKSARGFPKPVIHARVTGRGHARRLSYTVPVRSGLSVSFAEKGAGVYAILGTARGSRGTLKFAPADGPGGKRTIYAIVSENGVPNQRLALATYLAPPPAVPGRVHKLHVAVRGRGFRVSFGSVAGAAHYRVTIVGSDGRRLVRLLGAGGHTFSLPALGYQDKLAVTVAGLSRSGRSGTAARASAVWTSHVFACASASVARAKSGKHPSGKRSHGKPRGC